MPLTVGLLTIRAGDARIKWLGRMMTILLGSISDAHSPCGPLALQLARLAVHPPCSP